MCTVCVCSRLTWSRAVNCWFHLVFLFHSKHVFTSCSFFICSSPPMRERQLQAVISAVVLVKTYWEEKSGGGLRQGNWTDLREDTELWLFYFIHFLYFKINQHLCVDMWTHGHQWCHCSVSLHSVVSSPSSAKCFLAFNTDAADKPLTTLSMV